MEYKSDGCGWGKELVAWAVVDFVSAFGSLNVVLRVFMTEEAQRASSVRDERRFR